MNKHSILEDIRNKYIADNMENAHKVHYTSLSKDDGLETVFYDELGEREMEGYPTASDMVGPDGKAYSMTEFEKLPDEVRKQCRLRFYYLPKCHELYVGTTGSGKTTGCVVPQLRALSSQKNKPNLFITDPKGELFDGNAQHLKDKGYHLIILNFKALDRSDNWNPLFEVYDKKMELQEVGKGAVIRRAPIKKGLKLAADESLYTDKYIDYKGKAYPNGEIFDAACAKEKNSIELAVSSLVNSLASTFIAVQSHSDRSWEYGAQDLCKGILLAMLDDAVRPETGFTRDMMSIKTMHEYYTALRLPIQKNGDSRNDYTTKGYALNDHPLVKNKDKVILATMRTALDNAPNTMRSYMGVFDGALKDWKNEHIYSLTTGNSIDFTDIGDKPFAFFLITRDYDKSDNLIAGLAIDWIYRKMLERVEKGIETRALHFLLDEFGNIPPIKDFDSKISTARSRNIWFHLFVQSYQQVERVYGEKAGTVITENCNAQMFLGSQSYESKRTFSEKCGKNSVETFDSVIDSHNHNIIEKPVLPLSDLDLIEPGQIYVKRVYMPVFLAQFIRSYVCKKYGIFTNDKNGLENCTPFSYTVYTDEKYCYKRLEEFMH